MTSKIIGLAVLILLINTAHATAQTSRPFTVKLKVDGKNFSWSQQPVRNSTVLSEQERQRLIRTTPPPTVSMRYE